MSDQDKRGKQPEVPFGYEALLNDAQRVVLDRYRERGWALQFIRRPLFLEPTVVVIEPDSGKAFKITDTGDLEPFEGARKGM